MRIGQKVNKKKINRISWKLYALYRLASNPMTRKLSLSVREYHVQLLEKTNSGFIAYNRAR